MAITRIEWTELTWNPTSGCDKISTGCKNCYAETMSKRLKAMGLEKYKTGFKLALHPETLSIPYTWKTSKIVFVNSMSDLFHKDIPLEYIQKVFKVMNDCSRHTFQILTKRSERLKNISEKLTWTNNIWMGVSIENEDVMYRYRDLIQTEAKVKFLSLEPLLSPLPNLILDNIDWVIVGGESGHGARKMQEEWVVDIKNLCLAKNVPFFFKQWGGVNKKQTGRLLEGKIWDDLPNHFLSEKKVNNPSVS
ncbi:MAG: phage Gp37/Gp68 family protein [Blastocatellia bacterium]